MLARVLRSSVPRTASRMAMPLRRRMGGAPKTDAHHEAGHGAGASHEISAEMQAYLRTQAYKFGEVPPLPGQSRTMEAWEYSFWMVFVATIGMGVYLSAWGPNHNIHDWARDEAEERIRRRIQGLPVEYGVNYAALRALHERTGEAPESR